MNKDKLIEQLIKEKGGTHEQYLSLLNKIAYHESAHTMDPTITQKGGGPGRGKYQFETGKNQGGITAVKRTKQYLTKTGQEVPEWLDEASKGDRLDATQLTSEQQDMLFLGNMRMHPKADLANYVSGEESAVDFWANYHWAGADKHRTERVDSFKESMNKYDEELAYQEIAPKQPTNLGVNPDTQQMVATQDNTNMGQQDQSRAEINSTQSQDLYSYMANNTFNEINSGGRHEQNPQGGVPHGTGANGNPNLVEEGETTFNFGKDKFVFSDRVNLTDYINTKKNKVSSTN